MTTEATGLALLRVPLPELWLPVIGFESAYSVSSHGRVRSERRTRNGKLGAPVGVAERILRATANKDGHMRVALCRDGTRQTFFVHTLVLKAHVSPRPAGHQSCHNNGDPSDNHVTNLRWGTAKSNQNDRLSHGTSTRGGANPAAKLAECQVQDIRDDRRTNTAIAKSLNVSRSAISALKLGKTWSHVGERE